MFVIILAPPIRLERFSKGFPKDQCNPSVVQLGRDAPDQDEVTHLYRGPE
jgi:hypothetical protein